MKTEIFKTTYATYFLYNDVNILEQFWTNEGEEMVDTTFQEEMWNYLRIVEEKLPPMALISLQNFFFTIPNELQEWVDKNITSRDNKIIKKIAFLMPSDMIAQLAIELTMSEEEGMKYEQVGYFKEEQKAIDWLLDAGSASNTTFIVG